MYRMIIVLCLWLGYSLAQFNRNGNDHCPSKDWTEVQNDQRCNPNNDRDCESRCWNKWNECRRPDDNSPQCLRCKGNLKCSNGGWCCRWTGNGNNDWNKFRNGGANNENSNANGANGARPSKDWTVVQNDKRCNPNNDSDCEDRCWTKWHECSRPNDNSPQCIRCKENLRCNRDGWCCRRNN